MSQNRRSDDADNGSRGNKESEHQSTSVSASRSLEQEEASLSRGFQHVIAKILETLDPSPISQLEHGNLGSQTNNNDSQDVSNAVSDLMKGIESRVIRAVQHSIKPVIEDSIRRVAKEVVEVEVKKVLTRSSVIEMHSVTESLELRFCDNISLPVWTGLPIKGGEHKPLALALFDSETGQIVDSGPEASAEVEIVVLKGDLDDKEDFEVNVVGECKGKNSLLMGKTNLKLNKGIGSLGEISFKHKSKWMRKCELRLGARIVDPLVGARVKEAKTEPFTINDKRATLYEKRDCPSLSDPVWRLKNIDRRGVCYQHLSDKSIKTVQEFLTEFNLNPQGLQKILGSSMSANMLKETVANAMKCKLDDRILHYLPSSQLAYDVVFNAVGQLLGVRSKGAYVPVNQLSETEKANAQAMVVYAFKHWEEVRCLDKNSLSCGSSNLSNVPCCSHLHRLESISGHNGGNHHLMINETDSGQPHDSLADIVSSDNPTFVGPNNGSFNITDGCDSNRPHTNIIQPHSSDLGTTEDDISQQYTPFMASLFYSNEFSDIDSPMGSMCNSSMGCLDSSEFPDFDSQMGSMCNSQVGSMCNSSIDPLESSEFPDLDFQMDSTCNSSMGPLDSFEFPNLDFQTLNVQLDYFGDQGNKTGMETPADQPSAECPSVTVSAQAVAVGKVPRRWMRASMVLIVELIKRNVKSNDPKRQRRS